MLPTTGVDGIYSGRLDLFGGNRKIRNTREKVARHLVVGKLL